jgi:hypothetical protein
MARNSHSSDLWGPTYSRAVRLLLTRRDLARVLAPLLLIWFSARLPKERESGYSGGESHCLFLNTMPSVIRAYAGGDKVTSGAESHGKALSLGW